MTDAPEDNSSRIRNLQNQVKEALAESSQETSAAPQTTPIDQMVAISKDIVLTSNKLQSVETLSAPTREESVEEARKILRWLRNMEFTDRSMEEWLDHGSLQVVVAKKTAIQKLTHIFAAHLHQARLQNLERLNDAAIENARDAVSAMALTIAEHTSNLLPDNHPELARLDDMIDDIPERALMRQAQPVTRLLDTVELGLEHATGKEVSEVSAANRLLVISDRVQASAYELQSIKPFEPPAREESLEMARDILHKLKNMSFGDKPIEEIIANARPEAKAAFAGQLEELVDTYRNLLTEAAQLNPNILQDYRIKEANNAVGQFAYAVKLMAAKEIPASAAATQQIAADVTQMPEQWGDLHNRTVNRLLKSAEAGLEKAIEDLAQQQQEQQEAAEAQDMIEDALQNTDQAKRKKKKRRGSSGSGSKSRSGKGGKKQRKQHQDMTADDYVLKQGRFSEDARFAQNDFQITMPGLKPEDMDAIRKLGLSLRDIGNQLKDLSSTVATVSVNDKITPDDKTVSQRILEAEQQKHQPNGPTRT